MFDRSSVATDVLEHRSNTWEGEGLIEDEELLTDMTPPAATFLSTLAQTRQALPNQNDYRLAGDDAQANRAGPAEEESKPEIDAWSRFMSFQAEEKKEDTKFRDELGTSKTGREIVVKNINGDEVPYVPTKMVPCAFEKGNQVWQVSPLVTSLDERCGAGLFILKAFAEATNRSLADVWTDAVSRDSHEVKWTQGLYAIFGFEREPHETTVAYGGKGLDALTYRQHSAFSHMPPGREGDAGLYCMVMSARWQRLRDKSEAFAKALFPNTEKGTSILSDVKDLESLLLYPAMEAAEPFNQLQAPDELNLAWGNLLTPPMFSIAVCEALARMDSDKGWFCWKLLYNPGPEFAGGDGALKIGSNGVEFVKPRRVPLKRQIVKKPMPHIALHIEDSPLAHETGMVKLLHPREYEQFENRSSSTRNDRRIYTGAIAHLGINKRAQSLSAMVRPLRLRLDFFQSIQRRLKDSPNKLAELKKYVRGQPAYFNSLGLFPRRIWAVADYGFAQMPDFLTPSSGRTNKTFD